MLLKRSEKRAQNDDMVRETTKHQKVRHHIAAQVSCDLTGNGKEYRDYARRTYPSKRSMVKVARRKQ